MLLVSCYAHVFTLGLLSLVTDNLPFSNRLIVCRTSCVLRWTVCYSEVRCWKAAFVNRRNANGPLIISLRRLACFHVNPSIRHNDHRKLDRPTGKQRKMDVDVGSNKNDIWMGDNNIQTTTDYKTRGWPLLATYVATKQMHEVRRVTSLNWGRKTAPPRWRYIYCQQKTELKLKQIVTSQCHNHSQTVHISTMVSNSTMHESLQAMTLHCYTYNMAAVPTVDRMVSLTPCIVVYTTDKNRKFEVPYTWRQWTQH